MRKVLILTILSESKNQEDVFQTGNQLAHLEKKATISGLYINK